MHKLLLIVILFLNLSLYSQNKTSQQKLYYFISNDSLLGVRNEKGEIIIPAVNENYSETKNNERIKDNLIYLMPARADSTEPHSWGISIRHKSEIIICSFLF